MSMANRFRLSLTMAVREEGRDKAEAALRWVVGRTVDQPGNLGSFLGEEATGSGTRLRFDTEWSSEMSLSRYLSCDLFGAVLSVVDLAESPPLVFCEKVQGGGSVEQLLAVRQRHAHRHTVSNAEYSARLAGDAPAVSEAGGCNNE
jgi:hypothetical protein